MIGTKTYTSHKNPMPNTKYVFNVICHIQTPAGLIDVGHANIHPGQIILRDAMNGAMFLSYESASQVGRILYEWGTRLTEAIQEFKAGLEKIEGILHTEWSLDSFAGDTVKVYVSNRSSDTGKAVHALEYQIIKKYPESRFSVWISESDSPLRASNL